METTFDGLAYVRRLEKAGVPREQAEIQAQVFVDFADAQREKNLQELATKADLKDMRMEMQAMENRLIKWGVSALLTQIAVIVAVSIFPR